MILLYKLQGLDASYYNDVAISVKNILVAMWGFLKKKILITLCGCLTCVGSFN